MYGDWFVNSAVVTATAATVSLAVLVHYEGLVFLSRALQRHAGPQRIKVLYAIFGVLVLHVTEIWIFALTLWMLLDWPGFGHILASGMHVALGLLDAVYFSAVTYTTVGFGDLVLVGPIRFLAGTEALTGFVLITWSASFTYLEMERYWRNR